MRQRSAGVGSLLLLHVLAAAGVAEASFYWHHFNPLASSCAITWQKKEHRFAATKHFYELRGYFWDRVCYKSEQEDNGAPCTYAFDDIRYEFVSKGIHVLSTGTTVEETTIFEPEGAIPHNHDTETAQCSPECGTTDTRHFVTKRGDSPSDPWLLQGAGGDTVQVTATAGTYLERLHPYPGNYLFSSCAFTAAEHAALAAELVAVGTCTPWQAAEPPQMGIGLSVSGPAFDGRFDNPGDANVILVVGCLPCSSNNQITNHFFVDIEKKEWDNERYGYFWLAVNTDMFVDMMLNESRGAGAGAANLGLTEPGTYRIRAKSSVGVMMEDPPETENVILRAVGSGYTPWVEFTAGTLAREPLRVAALGAKTGALAESMASRKPDLTLAEYSLSRSGSGMLPAWLLRNVGTRGAPATDLLVCCRHVGESVCPEAYGEPTPNWDRCGLWPVYDELFPKPEGAPGTPGGGVWLTTGTPLPLPPAGSRYQIAAVVDASNAIEEISENNNRIESSAPRQLSSGMSASDVLRVSGQFDPAPPNVTSLQGAAQQGTSLPPTAAMPPGAQPALPASLVKPVSGPGSVRGAALQAGPGPSVLAPAVAVRRISLTPPQPRAGDPFSVAVEFSNSGTAASVNSAEYALACTVVAGKGACPLKSATKRFGSPIAPGGSLVVNLPASASPGTYRLEVKPLPEKSGIGKALEFTVAMPPIKGPDTKKPKTLPAIPQKLPRR